MTTSVTGRLIDGASAPIANLHVVVRDGSDCFDMELGHADTGADGTFAIGIAPDTQSEMTTPRKLGVYITTQGGREVNTSEHDDGFADVLALGDISLRQADVSGWTVTLLGAAAALDVRAGNAVLPLTDDEEAWAQVQKNIAGASSSVNMMQLQFDVPKQYQADAAAESPEIVLSFGSPIDPVNPRHLDANDFRLERMLLDAAKKPTCTVRVLISHNVFPIPVIVAGIVLLPLELLALLILWVFNVGPTRTLVSAGSGHFFGGGPSSDAAKYFKAASSKAKVAQFDTGMFNVVHAKAMLTDDNAAILLGSPFSQSYWDTHDHAIFEPRRGSAAGEPIPVHDVSMSLRGPVVQDVHEAFRLHWNRDAAVADQVAAITMPDPITTAAAGESLASIQLVRTINRGAFTSMPEGEKGVLEAYLRAIDNAQTYIYFENQYFTCDAIGTALTAALNDTSRPNLQVILMVNVIPDMPFYPKWQASLIDRIQAGAKANAARLGVFTAWTHNPPMPSRNQNKPMIMPNYLHTKSAVVDGTWATVGSANLDGASLDYFQILHSLQGGDNRNHELNYVIYNGVEGYASTDAIDKLRIKLWGEHLGIDAADPRLASTPAANNNGWLALWKQVAEAKRAALAADPTQINPALGHVLEYPAGTTAGYGRAPFADFLTKAHVDLTKVDLLDKTTPFSFKNSTWAS